MASFDDEAQLTISSDLFRPDNSEEKNVALFSLMLGRKVRSVSVTSMSGAGGFSGEMSRVVVCWDDNGEEISMVMKHTKENGANSSRTLGLAREGCFYDWAAASNRQVYESLIPKVYYSKGDMSSGDKVILLEDLGSFVQSGYFFGGGSPLNWGKDLGKEVSDKGLSLLANNSADPSEIIELVAEAACRLAAKYHGQHWMRQDLLDNNTWLKSSDWHVGNGRESWEAGQNYIKSSWEKLKSTKADLNIAECIYSPYIVGLIDASINQISWENFQKKIQSSHFTLAHGDFHPANMMCTFDNELFKAGRLSATDIAIRLVDWEVVGVGSGAQDIGQYMMSHMAPSTRRGCEDRLLRVYYDALMATIAECKCDGNTVADRGEYTFDMCYREYVYGGVERWVFLLIILAGMCPDDMQKYFLHQVESFAKDHGVTADSIGMSRL